MRSVKRWRHYCEFCRRGMFYRPRMVKHEQGCTLNINRVCGVCSLMENVQVPAAQLLADLISGGYKTLRKAANECPACILSAIRLATPGLAATELYEPPAGHWRLDANSFDYKAEMQQVWNDVNQRERDNQPAYY